MSNSISKVSNIADRASYEVVPIVDEPVVYPGDIITNGDTIKIDFYFSGSGFPPPNTKLYINFGGLKLNSEDPGEITTAVDLVPAEKASEEYEVIEDETQSEDDVATVAGSSVVDELQIDADSPSFIHRTGFYYFVEKDDVDPSFSFRPIVSEVDHGGYAPISISLNLASDASPGDYEITSILTYGGDNVVKQSRAESTIHVNSKTEQYRLPIVILGLILTFSALLVDIPLSDFVGVF
ncbi:hypothetical protein [Salinadaptatus halalkaliphilus]|uniref:hypothetical protein n=1 Tax=Salinadaptatus halalkaliphilus TaxID=2419781 RepID=UPI001141E121|nr:hypothetical protein [Salinadaptatus halalkaliphilus]